MEIKRKLLDNIIVQPWYINSEIERLKFTIESSKEQLIKHIKKLDELEKEMLQHELYIQIIDKAIKDSGHTIIEKE